MGVLSDAGPAAGRADAAGTMAIPSIRSAGIVCLGFVASLMPAVDPEITIARWPGGASAAWSCTLDDGLRDQLDRAVPALEAAGLRGTFFVIAGGVPDDPAVAAAAKPGAWNGIAWPELAALAARGHEIGNHSWSHPRLTKVDDARLRHEVDAAHARIAERLGRAPVSFCAPFNAQDGRVTAVVSASHAAWRTHQRQFGGKIDADAADRWLDEEEPRGGWTVLMVHGIATGFDAFVDPAVFAEHCRRVAARRDAGRLWPATFAAAAAYARTRDGARLTVTGEGAERVVTLIAEVRDPVPVELRIAPPPREVADAAGAVRPAVVRDSAAWVAVRPGTAVTLRW
jgi:peptidoglycan/xylan/chitin deacetylase (PgdA/CDA1 family)